MYGQNIIIKNGLFDLINFQLLTPTFVWRHHFSFTPLIDMKNCNTTQRAKNTIIWIFLTLFENEHRYISYTNVATLI